MCAGHITIEGVGVLHRKFSTAHDAEAWASFVTELGLDVIKVDRKLAPALDLIAGNVRDDFFGGRLQDKIASMAIFHAQEFGPVLLPAARLHPEFCRLYDGHQQLKRTRSVHLLTDNVFNFADHS